MRIITEHPNLGCFIISYFLVLFITPYIIFLAKKLNIVDIPSNRKIHTEPTPRLGGVVIAIAFFISVLSTLEYNTQLLAVLTGAIVIIIVGIVDDIKNIPALFKLFILFIVTIYLILYNIIISVNVPFTLAVIFTLFWFAYLSSCFNAIDNMNGLSSGIAAISSFIFYLISAQTGQFYMGFIAVGLCGACLGFLRFNFWKAEIFMGDSGSFFIGFVLSAIAVMGNWGTHYEPLKGVIVPVLVLWIPLYDLFLTTLLRIKSGAVKNLKSAISLSAKDHISHRISKKFNLSQQRTVLIIYLMSFIIGYSGFIARIVDIKLSICIFILIIIFSVYLGYILSKVEVEY